MLPRSFTISASSRLQIWILVVHIATLAVIAATPVVWWSKLILLMVVGTEYLRVRRLWGEGHPQRINEITIQSSGEWLLQLANGNTLVATMSGSRVFRSVIYLRFQMDNGKSRRLILPDDAVDRDTHRRLRAWLRLKAQPSDSDPANQT